MGAAEAKEVRFISDGNEETADVEFDAAGSDPASPSGSIVRRIGRHWKFICTTVQFEAAEQKAGPVLKGSQINPEGADTVVHLFDLALITDTGNDADRSFSLSPTARG